ncbi:MAG TPA: OsmC family protein [Longimicrobiales bacterium]
MHITAKVLNHGGEHRVDVATDGRARAVAIPPKTGAPGSDVNGGELLFLALATCYCNDVYREAKRAGIDVRAVEVEVSGEFGGPGEPARNVEYRARVDAVGASEDAVRRLLEHTDTVAEIQNTLRAGVPVRLAGVDVRVTSSSSA